MSQIPYLSWEDLAKLDITTADVICAIESAIQGKHDARVWSAPKAVIMPPDDNRYMMATLAAMDDPSLLAVKTVVLNPANPQSGLPQINGLVTMLNSKTGLPEAILDGNWVTAVRTAGLSCVAAKYLVDKRAASIGFVGAGLQARSHFKAFADMFPVKRIKIFSRGQPNIDTLTQLAHEGGVEVEIASSGQRAIEEVDIIVTSITLTDGAPPFLDATGLKAGAFAAVTDLGVPWIKDSFAQLDQVVIDDVEQEKSLPNKLCNPADVYGDLSALVLGDIQVRNPQNDRSLFVFRGHALGDLALSALALQTYIKHSS